MHNAANGTRNPVTGYWAVGIDGRNYYHHRLAFLFMTGEWPAHHVDHINGDRADNRWCNLRSCTPTVNQQNLRAPQSNNRTGLLGVTKINDSRRTKPYVAQLFANGKRVLCSYHATPEEAHQAYLKAKRELHEGNTL